MNPQPSLSADRKKPRPLKSTVAGSMVGDWVREYIESRGGKLLEKHWIPFGKGWFGDVSVTLMVGNATVTNSEMEIQGLDRGNQYWFLVRAVRAGKVGPWSDQGIRVVNI